MSADAVDVLIETGGVATAELAGRLISKLEPRALAMAASVRVIPTTPTSVTWSSPIACFSTTTAS